MERVPAYRKVYHEIREQIKKGSLSAGTTIPSELELEKQYAVSRTTVRKAISILVADGCLSVQQGRGTFVKEPIKATTQGLNHITSITETLQMKGYKVTTQGMQIQEIIPPQEIAEKLLLAKDEKVYWIQRVQCANGQPIAIMENYVVESQCPGLISHLNHFTGLYKFLESEYFVQMKSASEVIYATITDFVESQILRIPIGSPLICSKRVTYSEKGPLEYGHIKLNAKKYEYSINMVGR